MLVLLLVILVINLQEYIGPFVSDIIISSIINILTIHLRRYPYIERHWSALKAVLEAGVRSCITSPITITSDISPLLRIKIVSFPCYMVAANRTVCITTIKCRVDVQLSESLLFLHAISGCDTTSRPHGIGKVGVLKKYAALEESAATFMASESSKVALEKAGERVLLIMYGSQAHDLKTARLQKFQAKVATAAGYVPPEKLPSTSDAARFHSQRVFLQVQDTLLAAGSAWCTSNWKSSESSATTATGLVMVCARAVWQIL